MGMLMDDCPMRTRVKLETLEKAAGATLTRIRGRFFAGCAAEHISKATTAHLSITLPRTPNTFLGLKSIPTDVTLHPATGVFS